MLGMLTWLISYPTIHRGGPQAVPNDMLMEYPGYIQVAVNSMPLLFIAIDVLLTHSGSSYCVTCLQYHVKAIVLNSLS